MTEGLETYKKLPNLQKSSYGVLKNPRMIHKITRHKQDKAHSSKKLRDEATEINGETFQNRKLRIKKINLKVKDTKL